MTEEVSCVHIQGYTEQVCIFWVLDGGLSLAKLKEEIPWTRCCGERRARQLTLGLLGNMAALIMGKSPRAASKPEKKLQGHHSTWAPGL